MQDKILFREKQKFTQWWLWVILLGVSLIFVGTFLMQIIGGTPLGDNPLSNEGYVIGLFIIALFLVFFYYLELETIIKPSGIYVRFFPFHFSFKHYPWDSIRKCCVKQYSPIGDFGGWGVRFSLFGKGTAYNVDGDYGLQLEFLTPKKLLIGTQKPQELTEALDLANLTKL